MSHPLIEKIFKKRGIKDVLELTPEEQATFQQWQVTLTGDISVDKISEFCDNQVKLIESQLRDLNTPQEKIVRLNLVRNVYSAIRDLIAKPSAERESLEKYLSTLIQ